MKKVFFILLLILTSCMSGPRFETHECSIDPIVELEKALAQTEMALSVTEMRYMLWTWIVQKEGDETVQMKTRIESLRKTELRLSNEIRRRTGD